MKKILGLFLFLSLALTTAHAEELKTKLDPKKLSEVPNAVLLQDSLVSGGAPTARGLGQAAEQGIRTIIDVRTPEEGTAKEAEQAEALGLRYVNIPVSLANFGPEQAAELHKVLNDPATGPALIHCATGQRAAAVWALERNRHENIKGEQCLLEAKAKGLSKPALESKLQTLLQ